MSNKLYQFFVGLNLDVDTVEKLCESIVEIIGNSIDHSNTDCLVDIDVTNEDFKRKDDAENMLYYGINVVVLGFSHTPFYEKLKNKLDTFQDLNERYLKVKKAKSNHAIYFSKKYTEEHFYTVASFQHQISGSCQKQNSGGVGLTRLIESLEEKSSDHLCYMMSEQRILYFRKDFLQYDSDSYIGFNKENDFFNHAPEETLFANNRTFFPGTAYNLNFAIKKGDLNHGN